MWIVVAVAIVPVGRWPLLTRTRAGRDPSWTVDAARARIAELEDRLDAPDLPAPARAGAERFLLLAGAALTEGGRKAPDRAGRFAPRGLDALTGSPTDRLTG